MYIGANTLVIMACNLLSRIHFAFAKLYKTSIHIQLEGIQNNIIKKKGTIFSERIYQNYANIYTV